MLADWVLENDLDPGLVGVGVANSDPDGVAATLTHPASFLGNSDAGAHLQMMCATGDSTLLLTRHVRDRGDLSLESAVHKLTGRQADAFGLTDRGRLRVGAIADLTVFDLDELSWDIDVFVDDLPDGWPSIATTRRGLPLHRRRRADHPGGRHDQPGASRPLLGPQLTLVQVTVRPPSTTSCWPVT